MSMKEFWDKRYLEEDYAYGEHPNEFFRDKVGSFQLGDALFPAEGEGRNAVYAAKLGWNVCAFDISSSGKVKADNLARKHNLSIDYAIGPLEDQYYEPESFDMIGLFYTHFPPNLKATYHQQFERLLKPGGVIIFEAFSKDHLKYNEANPKVGGPKNEALLYSESEIKSYYSNLEIIELEQTETVLREGKYHQGLSSVVRFIGRK